MKEDNLDKVNGIDAVILFLKEINNGTYINEESRKSLFNQLLILMFPEKENMFRVLGVSRGAEKNIKIKDEKDRIKNGFQDADLGTTTVEWKKDLSIKKDKKTGISELKKYIAGKCNEKGYDESYKGLLTDGVKWIAYSIQIEQEKDEYTEKDIILNEIERIDANSTEAEYLYNFLNRYIILDNKLIITPELLKSIFGEKGDINENAVSEIKALIKMFVSNDNNLNKYIEMWNIYEQYTRNIENEKNLELYSQNIYLVILTRLLVARLLEMDKCQIDDEWLKGILDGSKFINEFKIKNYADVDIYSWIIEDKYIDKFICISRELYNEISKYDFINTNKDNLLHLIYEEIIPMSNRKKYGQKTTDFKLCDNIISRLNHLIDTDKKIIEPAVGSGSLLRSIINNLKTKMNILNMSVEEQLDILQSNIVGIDIDPTAIILAKAEWIITNSELIKSSKKSIEIPIYHADSLFNSKSLDKNIEYITINADNKIFIKKIFIDNIYKFKKYLETCDETSKVLLDEGLESISEEDIKFIDQYINIEKNDSNDIALFKQSTKDICIYLLNKRKNLNSDVWKGLLFNNNIPQLLFNSFDIIISNPPWLALSSLPEVEYKNDLKKLSSYYKIKAISAASHQQEIATVFALKCIDKYLKKGGDAAFIMPGSIISGDQHILFRNKNFKSIMDICFEELWDIPNDINPFNMNSCVLFVNKSESNQTLKMRKLSSLSKWENSDLQDIVLSVIGKKNAWTVNNEKRITHNYYESKFLQGADLMPRTAVFVESSEDIYTLDPEDEIIIRTSEYALNNKNGKKLKGKLFSGVVKKKYLYKTTISEMLLPYHICKYNAVVALPIMIEDEKIKFVSNREMIQDDDINSKNWFLQFDKLEEFSKKDFRSYLNTRDKLLQQRKLKSKYIVHVGAGGKYPCAAVEEVEEDKLKFIADQTTYVAEINDELEAYYIVAILNSEYMYNAINDFQARGAFGERHIHKIPYLFLPRYDSTNKKHVEIATLSKNISKQISTTITDKEESMEYALRTRRERVKIKYASLINEINNLVNSL